MVSRDKTLIVVPTFNEAENIAPLFAQIQKHLPGCHILFVDDNSPDSTQKEITKLKNHESSTNYVHLLARQGKLGLGTAYIAGFNWGLKNDYEYYIQMDADFSHNPSYLPEFKLLLEKHDAVIGSRYIDGGGVSNWNFFRRLISKFGSLYARVILNMKVMDLTGGFNAWRREVLEKISLQDLRSEGYSFQIELKYRASRCGFRLFETPILFEERRAGKSKMSLKIIFEAFYRVFLIRRWP
ncbi:MAG: polyprenol monophosphomannose synthase [Oligoflexales bacterium]|nr:polyprenol monophosphomannose synthase [Oligoflexales bacterium]